MLVLAVTHHHHHHHVPADARAYIHTQYYMTEVLSSPSRQAHCRCGFEVDEWKRLGIRGIHVEELIALASLSKYLCMRSRTEYGVDMKLAMAHILTWANPFRQSGNVAQ